MAFYRGSSGLSLSGTSSDSVHIESSEGCELAQKDARKLEEEHEREAAKFLELEEIWVCVLALPFIRPVSLNLLESYNDSLAMRPLMLTSERYNEPE